MNLSDRRSVPGILVGIAVVCLMNPGPASAREAALRSALEGMSVGAGPATFDTIQVPDRDAMIRSARTLNPEAERASQALQDRIRRHTEIQHQLEG